MVKVNIIVAYNRKDRGIGYKNKILWRIPEDMKFFSDKTKSVKNNNKINCVIMGYNTWISLSKPLKDRLNIVITNKNKNDIFSAADTKQHKETRSGYVVFTNNINIAEVISNKKNEILDKMLDNGEIYTIYKDEICRFSDINKISIIKNKLKNIYNIYIIGGESIYNYYINKKYINNIYVTEIELKNEISSDRYFNNIPKYIKYIYTIKTCDNKQYTMNIKKYKNMLDNNSDEHQYVNLLKNIIQNGIYKNGRNGGYYTTFSHYHVFDLQKGYPLLTTKKMNFISIIEELLFFLKGDTNANNLSNKGIKIWDKNSSRQFLDNIGLTHRKPGDIGPMYGWNWRYYGAKYKDCNTDYKRQGIDQLYNVIDTIINDPNSRRIIMTSYDCTKLHECVLPPCHGLCIQFFIRNNYLDCSMYQRSCDSVLGYPFNIASYSALLIIMSYVTNYEPGKLYISLGDTHIYEDHYNKIKKYIHRSPLKSPSLSIIKNKPKFNTTQQRIEFIENLTVDDFQLNNYYHYSGLKFDMIA